MKIKFLDCFVATLLAMTFTAQAEEKIHIAVASNFLPTLSILAENFSKETNVATAISSGSTGMLYTQITQGAPYDIFFAADEERPKRLEKEGYTLPGLRLTYALGKLVLLVYQPKNPVDESFLANIKDSDRLVIAQPNLAPYGKAAQEVLIYTGLLKLIQKSIIYGNNVNQAFQFIHSGSVNAGFVALSQVQSQNIDKKNYWLIPSAYYNPIKQQAVLLHHTKNTQNFFEFIQSKKARKIIADSGYGLSEDLKTP